MNNIYTIGFTGKTAEKFFSLLKKNNIKTLIDVRLNNISQLAAFAKKDDLKYFLKEIVGCNYIHRPDLAPTESILKDYKKHFINWEEYSREYMNLLQTRNIISIVDKDEIIGSVLLCSEHDPKCCHRRLLAEYFKSNWENIEIIHLK
jgi:uncharacterized protein (DUF488 family)